MIRVTDLSYSYGLEPIFSHTSFHISHGQKVGLVGINGSGKSTLFKLLSRTDFPSEGKIESIGSIVNVPQEVKTDIIMESCDTIRQYLDPENKKLDFELQKFLSGLELRHLSLQHHPQNLSGGQKTKLAIIRALLQEPDILLLDEPTNFLDTQGKKWIANFLSSYPKTIIIVSHDLDLLDKSIDKILSINHHSHQIEVYKGNYSAFVRAKEIADALKIRHIISDQKHIDQMKEGLLKISHFKSQKGVRQRLNLQHRIEKLEESLPQMPPHAKKIRLNLPLPTRCGSLPIWLKNITKSFGSKIVLDQVSLDIHAGERIALVGPNGAGKSTLIKIMMGIIKPDFGEIIADQNLSIGYYSQELDVLDYEETLINTIKLNSQIGEGPSRALLAKFLFSGDKVFQKVSLLSGGEKTRLSIATLLAKNYNLLILDEPTTYLDVLSQRIILESIKEYKGALLIVSHTPEFIQELNLDRKLYLPENKFELCKLKL